MYTPTTIQEFIGQKRAVSQVQLIVEASKSRGEVPPHVLISGPGGTGKTTLAQIIAKEVGGKLVEISPAAMTTNKDVFDLFNRNTGSEEPPMIVFLDEIHRINIKIEEDLYQPMDNLFIIKKGARPTPYNLYPWTLIAATTLPGKMSEPFRSRFGVNLTMEPYTEEDIETIILQSSERSGFKTDEQAIEEISIRSRGNPRLANHLLDRCYDMATVTNGGAISRDIARKTFAVFGIDSEGLDNQDRKYLTALIEADRAIGIDSLVPILHTDKETIGTAIEPYLVQKGFVTLTNRGREITDYGAEYMEGYIHAVKGIQAIR